MTNNGPHIYFFLFSIAIGLAAVLPSSRAGAADKHPVPPRGWNSYTGYSIAVTAGELLKNIAFLSKNLLQYGSDTVTVDNGWFLSGHGKGITIALDEYGAPASLAHFFPHGV